VVGIFCKTGRDAGNASRQKEAEARETPERPEMSSGGRKMKCRCPPAAMILGGRPNGTQDCENDDGRRCRVAIFGLKGIVDTSGDDFRFPSSVGYVGAALAVLEADGNVPCSISGLAVNWHQYMNSGINAYWRNRIRA